MSKDDTHLDVAVAALKQGDFDIWPHIDSIGYSPASITALTTLTNTDKDGNRFHNGVEFYNVEPVEYFARVVSGNDAGSVSIINGGA